MTHGRFMDAQNYKQLSPINFEFRKILKIQEKNVNPQIFLLLLYKEKMLKD